MDEKNKNRALANLLTQLLDILPENTTSIETATTSQSKKLRNVIDSVVARLRLLADKLDPIQHPRFVFDPLNPEFIGRLVGRTLLEQDRQPLVSVTRFYGSGVYALYYSGDFSSYRSICKTETPIYVGKADPRTPDAKTYIEQGPKLASRLAEHAKSIRAASSTLAVEDFECRILVVQSGWQRSAEDYLLSEFKPIWNSQVCYGFGKHGDDPRTRSNSWSPWDSLHPGRLWATKVGNKPSLRSNNQIIEQIAEHYRKFPPRS